MRWGPLCGERTRGSRSLGPAHVVSGWVGVGAGGLSVPVGGSGGSHLSGGAI